MIKAKWDEWEGLIPPRQYEGCLFLTRTHLTREGWDGYTFEQVRDALVDYESEVVTLKVEHEDGLVFEAPCLVVWPGLHGYAEVVEAAAQRLR